MTNKGKDSTQRFYVYHAIRERTVTLETEILSIVDTTNRN